MSVKASGCGKVFIDKRSFASIEDHCDLEYPFIATLDHLCFDYELDGNGNLTDLWFAYGEGDEEEGGVPFAFLEQIGRFVAPGSWFRWIWESGDATLIDFGGGEEAAIRWPDESATLTASLLESYEEDGKPELSIRFNVPKSFAHPMRIDWNGTAEDFYRLLSLANTDTELGCKVPDKLQIGASQGQDPFLNWEFE